jgi:hypothetical protein
MAVLGGDARNPTRRALPEIGFFSERMPRCAGRRHGREERSG